MKKIIYYKNNELLIDFNYKEYLYNNEKNKELIKSISTIINTILLIIITLLFFNK